MARRQIVPASTSPNVTESNGPLYSLRFRQQPDAVSHKRIFGPDKPIQAIGRRDKDVSLGPDASPPVQVISPPADLMAPRVNDNGKPSRVTGNARGRRVESRYPDNRDRKRVGNRLGRGNPHPQARPCPRPQSNGDKLDPGNGYPGRFKDLAVLHARSVSEWVFACLP